MDKVQAVLPVCAAAHLCSAAHPRVAWGLFGQGRLEAPGFWQREKGSCSICRAAASGVVSVLDSGENKAF